MKRPSSVSDTATADPHRGDWKRNKRRNLCGQDFHPRTTFDRFCPNCKDENELFRFSEWLPELDQAIAERISA